MNVLLDTCTFLWLISGASQLSARAQVLFQDPANRITLSAASSWEIAIKYQIGRLPLPAPPASYIPEQRAKHQIQELPIDEESTLTLPKLPDLHRDPFDRLLVCQAIVHAQVILTPDPWIERYPVKTAW